MKLFIRLLSVTMLAVTLLSVSVPTSANAATLYLQSQIYPASYSYNKNVDFFIRDTLRVNHQFRVTLSSPLEIISVGTYAGIVDCTIPFNNILNCIVHPLPNDVTSEFTTVYFTAHSTVPTQCTFNIYAYTSYVGDADLSRNFNACTGAGTP